MAHFCLMVLLILETDAAKQETGTEEKPGFPVIFIGQRQEDESWKDIRHLTEI